jgi:hypothetical protein
VRLGAVGGQTVVPPVAVPAVELKGYRGRHRGGRPGSSGRNRGLPVETRTYSQ